MDNLEVLIDRVRTHPAARGGPADECYWLDLLEVCLEEFEGGLDSLAKMLAINLERHPEKWEAYIAGSKDDLLAYKTLQALLTNVRSRQLDFVNASPEEMLVWHAAQNILNGWAQDVALEIIWKPKDGPDKRKLALRNAMIAAAVNGIHEVSGIPYEFEEPKSGEPRTACHVVADRLGMSFGAVRSIWRKERELLNQAREYGLIPQPQQRQRRT